MSNLELHAKKEMEIAGLFDEDSDYGGMLADAVMKLIKVFGDEGHSGASASMAVSIFEKVARFEPLTPLTGEAGEWIEIGASHDGAPQFQNIRCSHVFKSKEGAYDINGKVFREPNGCCYTNGESHVPVTFPYIPKTEYVDVPASDEVA